MTYTKTVALPVGPDEAFALVTEPERLRRWQAVTARVDLRAGGDYRWTVTPGHVAAGIVTEVDPGRRVVLTWGWEGNALADPSTVTITIEPTDGGSQVTLEHEGLTAEQEARHAEGWDHFLERLERAAADGDAGPDAWAAYPEQMEPLPAAEASLAVLQQVLRQVGPDDRHRPTPCADFDVHQLAEHLLGTLVSLGSMAGSEIVRPESDSLEDVVATMAADVIEAWHARGLDGTVQSPAGEAPAAFIAGIIPIELLLHAWDFAQATAAQLTVADELVKYVAGLAEQVVPAGRGRAFGDEVAPPVDADALTRLASYSGRTPMVA